MKKIVLFVLIISMFVSITACADNTETNTSPWTTSPTTEEVISTETEIATPTETAPQTMEPVPTEEILNLSMEVEIPDSSLRVAVLSTLSTIGHPIDGVLTAEDMMALDELVIVSYAWGSQQNELNFVSDNLKSYNLLKLADGIETLEGLQYAQNLTKLIILGQPPHIAGGTPNTFQDLSPLANLDKLEMLSLRFNNLHDISPIAELENLKILELQYNPELKNISAVSELKNLSVLDLQHCYEADFNAISNLENLEYLYLCGNIRLNVLSELKNLKHLECREGDAVGIWDLYSLQNIVTLDLSFQHINDINVLAGMSNLENLNLYDNEIEDISVLLGLQNLQILAIDEDTYSNNEDIVNTLKAQGCQIYTEDIFSDIIRVLRDKISD